MGTDQLISCTLPPAAANPHVLWRQLLGFVLWVGILSLPAGGPVGAVLCLTLGGLTFADAWKSGIYKRPDRRTLRNISPMAWGIAIDRWRAGPGLVTSQHPERRLSGEVSCCTRRSIERESDQHSHTTAGDRFGTGL